MSNVGSGHHDESPKGETSSSGCNDAEREPVDTIAGETLAKASSGEAVTVTRGWGVHNAGRTSTGSTSAAGTADHAKSSNTDMVIHD